MAGRIHIGLVVHRIYAVLDHVSALGSDVLCGEQLLAITRRTSRAVSSLTSFWCSSGSGHGGIFLHSVFVENAVVGQFLEHLQSELTTTVFVTAYAKKRRSKKVKSFRPPNPPKVSYRRHWGFVRRVMI